MNEPDLARLLRNLSKYSGLVFRLSMGIILGFFGGRYLDQKWSTEPFLMLLGVFVGLGSGLYFLYSQAQKDIGKK